MGKKAVVQFTARHHGTQAFYLERHGEPHFVYEFLWVLENDYECPADAAPTRFAELAGNFIGGCHALRPWRNSEELLEDNGVYVVEVLRQPWHIKRLVPPSPTSNDLFLYNVMTEVEASAEREKARVHPINASGQLHREIREKNDRHFMDCRNPGGVE